MRYRLTVPATDGAEAVRSFVTDWINHPALRTLVVDAGGPPPVDDPVVDIAQLVRFSDRWDFRRGAERSNVVNPDMPLGADVIVEVGAELGMTVAHPPVEVHYDHVLVLGGAARSSCHRVEHLYHLRSNGIVFDAATVLTTLRPLLFNELDSVPTGLLERRDGLDTEFALLVRLVELQAGAAAHVIFREHAVPSLANAIAAVGDVTVIAAPSSDPERRANTSDTYNAYANRIAPGQSVLIVTSSMYLPYQFLVALQALGWDQPLTVEVVGFPPELMGGLLTGPHNVLQELRSAILAAEGCLAHG